MTNDQGRKPVLGSLVAMALLGALACGAAEDGPLVTNGSFETADPADPGRPSCWDRPDGLGVRWDEAPPGRDGAAHGKAIRMDTSVSQIAMVEQWKKVGLSSQWDIPKPDGGPIAGTYGLSFYSAAIPVRSGQPYRVSFDFFGPSGGGKLWVRGYGLFRGEMRRRYETVVFCRTYGGGWTRFVQSFHPTRERPEVSEMKVMLFAYWPPAVYWFDNVRIEPMEPAEYEAEVRAAKSARE